ncbi:hypothetical protein U6A24_08185 [Aquimarina gracilis]|uniref:Secreted protein (Por secretion system target) n=1 Tax=Aquimarina gracilis TaxID=874422 RepID=A0ABU5ZTP3_9FLAO|nr:hypothetical protein [Aquimarina gracilis]MEB3345432.1 hypothetical protein [Aquimarina gracilis]
MSKLKRKFSLYNQKAGGVELPFKLFGCLMIIFMFSSGFTTEINENSFSLESNICTVSVDAGPDQAVCNTDQVTLTALVSGQSECVDCTEEYEVKDTYRCGKDLYYVLWLKNDAKDEVRRFSNVDLQWDELADGTATLKGKVVDNDDPQIVLEVDVTYSGRTVTAPSGSPKEHFCNTENADGWIYYTDVTGSVNEIGGPLSFTITRKGPAFQLGNGANVTEDEAGRYGASGWFDTSTNCEYNRGDFNFNLDCITSTTNEVSYEWSTGETTPSITVTQGGTYTVTVKDCSDCVTSDSVEVTFDTLTVDAGDDQSICTGDSATLTATEGDSYLWSTGEETQSIVVSPSATTEYSVTVVKGSCEDSDNVTVFVETVEASAGDDQSICIGDSATLTATGGDSYLWSTGEETASISVSPETTTEYTVVVRKGACEDEDVVTVAVNSVTANAGQDQSICIGDSATLTATGGDSYLWSTGEETASISVSPETTTEYTVVVRKGVCEDEDVVTVAVNSVTANAGEDQSICVGDSATLTATGGDSYLWSTGEETASIIVSPETTTEYTVIVRNEACEATDAVTVTVNSVTANAGEDVSITQGDSVTLTATGGDTYIWSTGEETQSITVSPETTTEYSVTAFKDGCEGSDSVIVTVEAGCPVIADAGPDVTVCQGESVTLTASGGDSYVWSNPFGVLGTTQSITITPSPIFGNEYTVTVSKDGCAESDTDTVIVTIEDCTDPNEKIASVYPTLVKSGTKLNLDLNVERRQYVRISLHDLSGGNMSPVITKLVEPNTKTLDVDFSKISQLSSGIYVVRIMGEGWSRMEKIVISNRDN